MPEQPTGDSPAAACMGGAASECSQCSVAGRLNCRFRRRDLFRFVGTFLLFALPAAAGMALGGYGWFIPGWLVLVPVLLGVWENRVLCAHCPYYARDGRVLLCFANYGLGKLWKYHPEPISTPGRVQFLVIVFLLMAYPFPFLVLGRQYILLALTTCALVLWALTLWRYSCTRCVNFSCVFNRVPKDVVDEFLRRNPVMRKAWEESGWKVEDGEAAQRAPAGADGSR
ncbi:MAG: hypothetical protein SVP26_09575 [Chloroflexota bacterium]|nr:hypothetical protein [Chloroflexota bacterium]